jgi:hypothetical protein
LIDVQRCGFNFSNTHHSPRKTVDWLVICGNEHLQTPLESRTDYNELNGRLISSPRAQRGEQTFLAIKRKQATVSSRPLRRSFADSLRD